MKRLLLEKHEVYAILRETSDLCKLPAEVREDIHFHACRYDSYDSIQEIFSSISRKEKRLVLFHLAAYVLSGGHDKNDVSYLIESNLAFGTMLVDAAVHAGIRCLVNTGTYWQYYESSSYHPVNLYAATKQAYQDILRYFEEVEGVHVINLILYDIYGPAIGGVERKKILDYLREHADELKMIDMSLGEQQMNYVYVEDVVRAYLRAGDILIDGQYNLCGSYAVRADQEFTLRTIVEAYLGFLSAKLRIRWGGIPYRKREVMQPTHHLPILPGWKAEVTLEDGLKRCAIS